MIKAVAKATAYFFVFLHKNGKKNGQEYAKNRDYHICFFIIVGVKRKHTKARKVGVYDSEKKGKDSWKGD